MAEFKIANNLSDEVSSLKTSGKALAADQVDISTSDVETLKTSMRYVQQQKSIRSLLRLYAELIAKDGKDLDTMISEAKRMDQVLAGSSK